MIECTDWGISSKRSIIHMSPRASWGLNLSYLTEGFAYLGTLQYLALYFNEYVGLNDQHAGWMVGVMASGITLSMFFLGGRVDKLGLRKTLFTALGFMLSGRLLLSLAPDMGLAGGDIFSAMNLVSLLGVILVVIGFGMYQPAIYAGTGAVATAATSGMAFAMLYSVYNLGGWLPTFMTPIRNAFGIKGALGFYAVVSFLGMVGLAVLLTKKVLEKALKEKREAGGDDSGAETAQTANRSANGQTGIQLQPLARALAWLKSHPLTDPKFSFFIFALIPVQTLIAYLWFILPQYVSRAHAGAWVGENFETALSLNPILIFFLCPAVATLSARANIYNTVVLGTAVMAASAFLLSPGPTATGLFAYILVFSVGEAIWRPRFLQYATEIAPPGRSGAYMGVAQFPWFITKTIVPLYSGLALSKWCPDTGPAATGTMWLLFGLIAIVTPVMLFLAKGWVGRGFAAKGN